MTTPNSPAPAPVHQQVPPARAATSASDGARRAARGSLPWMTGTAGTALDERAQHWHQETTLNGVTPR